MLWEGIPAWMSIAELEQQIGLKLPEDYRWFLEHHRDAYLPNTQVFPFAEQTPFGQTGALDELKTLESYKEDGVHLFEDVEMLIIGDNLFGYPTCLSLRSSSYGHIFYYDPQQRVSWPDSQFHSQFENLAESVKSYLVTRTAGELPSKEPGMESFYHAADSFSAFQALLKDDELPAE